MSLTLKEVEHIAKLARLELSEEEKGRYRQQLSAILEHVARLETLDTASIAPTASVFSGDSHLRADAVHAPLTTAQLLKNAPDTAQGQFKIPPVFE